MLDLTKIPAHSLGKQAEYLLESDEPLTVTQAMALANAGHFSIGDVTTLSFGIGSKPVWIHLTFHNPTSENLSRNWVGGVTWLDHVAVYILQNGEIKQYLETGDETPTSPGLLPVMGYTMAINFPPGYSDLLIRVESIDPLVIPIELLGDEELQRRRTVFAYIYGFIYGYFMALCIYNLLLFAGLNERSYLYYSLSLISILFCNLAYTGHGLAELWPHQATLQRYVILVWMVIYGVIGLLFASRFLSLAHTSPRSLRLVHWLCGLGLSGILLCLLFASHMGATIVAYSFIGAFTLGMLLLGVQAVQQRYATGLYFLVATLMGLLGVTCTVLAVWGNIPFTAYTFHAVELGVILEATLLATALAYRIRQYQKAEKIAKLDPLTGMNNRRSFMELANQFISSAERLLRPLSLVVMDIDHFKHINDRYGHQAGDTVLITLAGLLKAHSRNSDIVARWGGEEFIWLMMDTNAQQAAYFTERLRQAIHDTSISIYQDQVKVTASFGVAEHIPHTGLDELFRQADTLLYQAKQQGRNRVCHPQFEAVANMGQT